MTNSFHHHSSEHRRLLRRILNGEQEQTTKTSNKKKPTLIEKLHENNPNFQELKLSSIHANTLDRTSLFRAMQQNKTVKTARIHGFFVQKLTEQEQQRLWDTIGGDMPQLLETLHCNYFLDFPLQTIHLNTVLSRAVHLTKLSIHDTILSNTTTGSILDAVSLKQHVNLTSIVVSQLYLDRNNNNSSSNNSANILNSFVAMCTTAPNLQKLIVRMALQEGTDSLLSCKTLESLAQTNLVTLELRRMVHSNYHLSSLMNHHLAHKTNPTGMSHSLKELVLHGENQLNESACMAMAHVLQENSVLERLELWGSNVDEAGFLAIAKALKSNRRLKTLYLSHDNILSNKNHRQAILEMLQHNVFLESMFLRGNCHQHWEFLQTMDFYLQMNTTYIRRLLLHVNVNKEQILDKLNTHSSNLDYLFHILRGNPGFILSQECKQAGP
ncbi:expressed unknown protein [Seminavis robusta]|uniref:Uncharacterized protein n=1 Tax=Seminavis robusta TaxID=568900 RepID=A0A9N8EWA0_9STRA|nr:expressed unknown protein [Seminavis robusta]|eukprot:Sro1885_g303540.1 n/a (440) ;mRNA; f:6833-8152